MINFLWAFMIMFVMAPMLGISNSVLIGIAALAVIIVCVLIIFRRR